MNGNFKNKKNDLIFNTRSFRKLFLQYLIDNNILSDQAKDKYIDSDNKSEDNPDAGLTTG